ncbi:MAG: histidine kinase [Anaerolineales bacterium]|nr:histidine kinase [Anaerolineales bacterium]
MTEQEEEIQEQSPVEAFAEKARTELEQVTTKLSEINMLIEQSQGEVDKLAQRNASMTNRLHQIQSNFDTVPREDIRSAYESAKDAQQRLFTMRGQLEKLEADRTHLEQRATLLREVLELLEGAPSIEPGEGDGSVNGDLGIEQVIEAQEEERRKISRQIHDGPAQALSNFILQTEIALRLFDSSPEQAEEELASLKDSAAATFSQVRDFIFDLRPMMLDDLGLAPTVRRYCEAFEEKSGLEINTVITGTERRLAPHREVMAFRAIQEFLANAREHAQATQVKVTLDMDDAQIRAAVEDNGIGFDPTILEGEQEGPPGGLRRLRDRISQIGGSLEVDSTDSATRVSMSLPAGD